MDKNKKGRIIELTSRVSIGPGVIDLVGEVVESLFVDRSALVVCDNITYDLAGKRIIDALSRFGISAEKAIITEADMKNVDMVRGRSIDMSVIFGVGGGRPIDVAKYSAYLEKKPFVSVPTAASHDGVASGRASITVEGMKNSLPAMVPAAVVADTELISSAPRRLNISGVADVVSNLTAVEDWHLSYRVKGEVVSNVASELSVLAAGRLMDERDKIKEMGMEGVGILMESVILSGTSMAIAGSSRPASGAEHLISHALDKISKRPALHGEQCGVASIFTAYLQGGPYDEIKEFLSFVGAPVNIVDLGIDEETFVKAALQAHRIRPERYTILGNGLTESAVRRAAKETGVIP